MAGGQPPGTSAEHELALQAALNMIDDWSGGIDSLLAEIERVPGDGPDACCNGEAADSIGQEEGEEQMKEVSPANDGPAIGDVRVGDPSSCGVKPSYSQSKKQKKPKKCTVTRRKEEIRELKATIKSLSAKLSLSATCSRQQYTCDARERSWLWEEIALRQYTSRREAELENRRLSSWLRHPVLLTVEAMLGQQRAYHTDRIGSERPQRMRLSIPSIDYHMAAQGLLLTYSTPKNSSHWPSTLKVEQLRYMDLMAKQIDSVLAMAKSQYELDHGAHGLGKDCSHRHVAISHDGHGGTVIDMYTKWLTPFTRDAVADELWKHTMRASLVLLEEVNPSHHTMFLDSVMVLLRNNQVTGTFDGKYVSRRWRDGADSMIVSSVTGQPSLVLLDSEHANVLLHGEDWQRVRPVPSSPQVSQVEWYRRAHISWVGSRRPALAPEPEGISGFVKAMTTLVDDDLRLCQQTLESTLLLAEH